MFTFSNFKHEWTKSQFTCEMPNSKDYKVYINGEEVPVYTCRISKYPFNTWWPGHQRPVNQTDLVSYVNLVADEKVKIAVDMHHKVPHCNSRQLFKGVAGGSSRVDFYGKIIVAQDAQRTEAYQENHNILLSDNAKVDTKPQLEIYADDVKCSHGATIGRLNEEEQFYMRSRGITLEDAKVLQMISFIAPVLENIPEADREQLSVQFEDAIRNIVHNS